MEFFKKTVSFLLLVAVCFCALAGCNPGSRNFRAKKVEAEELTAKVAAQTVESKEADEKFSVIYNNFAVKMTKALYKNENACVSPLSIAAAFGMVTNGAKGETKTELEALLGADVQTINAYFARLMQKSSESKELHVANSVWSRKNAVTIENDFLNVVKNNYLAQFYSAPFDGETVKDINKWVYNNTRGGIDKIIDDIDADTVLYLLNALDFEAEWKDKFEKNSVRSGTFYGVKNEAEVTMMYATEQSYIETEKAKGFIKPYVGGEYKFAAILPDEDTSIDEFLSSLTGESLTKILSGAKKTSVEIGLPKFDFENRFDLIPTLKKLGVNKAFSADADFTALGKTSFGNLYIGEVVHKTRITVNEQKTKASAVTEIGGKETAMPSTPSVILNRPFVYMILDSSSLPVFMGVIAQF